MTVLVTVNCISNFMDVNDLKVGQKIILKKEPENDYDEEAIAVYLSDSMQMGYIANSVNTKGKGTYSAGRLLDKIPSSTEATIMVVIKGVAIATVEIPG